jgi:amidohydrolase
VSAAAVELELLRYPIGRFVARPRLTAAERHELIDDIAALPTDLRAAVADLSAEQLATPYRAGGWTVRSTRGMGGITSPTSNRCAHAWAGNGDSLERTGGDPQRHVLQHLILPGDALMLQKTLAMFGAAAALLGGWPDVLSAQHRAPTSNVLTAQLEARIRALEPKVLAWRRDIHEHPELGNREVRTAKLVADHLTSLGIEVQTGVAHTGVVGLLRGGRPGPVVALRADMDALPVAERVDVPFASKAKGVYNGQEVGVMHACGHDTHVAILMGVAEALASMRNEIPGTVKFIFQPAEEGPPVGEQGGAELMVKEGVLTNPDVAAAFALHISSKDEVGSIFYTPRGAMASSDDFQILVKGRQTHGAAPWNGVDPIVTAAQIINALQTIVSRQIDLTENPAVVTVGKIQGGVRSNIVPEQVELIGTLRALDADDRKAIHDKVRSIAQHVAAGMGATVEVKIPYSMSYPVTYNNPELTNRMLPVLEAVAGSDRVRQNPPVTGAEDFSFIADRVPSFYITLGGRPTNVSKADAPDHHTPDFYVDEGGLMLGVRALTAMALQYLQTPSRATVGNR